MVHVIIFIHQTAGLAGKRLLKTVQTTISGCQCQVCRNIPELTHQLLRPVGYGDQELFVLLADNQNRLNQFVDLRDFIEGKWMVLIVGDRDSATLNRAHRLLPRFLTIISDNFDDVVAVLKKKVGMAGGSPVGCSGYAYEQNKSNEGGP